MWHSAVKDSKVAKPYLEEFFNIEALFKNQASERTSITRVVNALIEALNKKDSRLPKYLIVILDKDILTDIDDLPDLKDEDEFIHAMKYVTDYVVRQINTKIHRKCIDLYEARPGAVLGCHTKIVFIRMLRRVGSFHPDAKISRVCGLRNKFNDALNDAVAKIDQRILTIASCNHYEDLDKHGNLSI